MSTVTGIIDGTGSIGSAVQGVLIGWLGDQFGWAAVFYFLMITSVISAICLLRIVGRELNCCVQREYTDSQDIHSPSYAAVKSPSSHNSSEEESTEDSDCNSLLTSSLNDSLHSSPVFVQQVGTINVPLLETNTHSNEKTTRNNQH